MPSWKKLAPAMILMTWLGALNALADKPAPTRSFKQYSANKAFFMEFTPSKSFGEEGRGVAKRAATGEPLWEVRWYARRVILTNDGVHLIRPGTLASDWHRFSDLAVAFYKNGKELKRYSIGELIKDRTKIKRTASHYFWQDGYVPEISPDQRLYPLCLLDGSIYIFEVATGRMVHNQELTQKIKRARDLYHRGK